MQTFDIRIPSALDDRSLIRFFRAWQWRTDLKGEVFLDLRETEFLAPWALTLFSLYALWLSEECGVDVGVRLDAARPAGAYALRLGLLELFEAPRPEALVIELPVRAVPLTRFRTSQDVPGFASRVLGLLAVEDEDLAGAIKYSLIELLRNVVQHSHSATGGLSMAQYYPHTGLVELVVADMGVGIRASLSERYPDLPDDLAAIRLSLFPHVSGTFANSAYSSMRDNAGLGLFFIKEIATRGGGGFFLGSGKALVDLWGNLDGNPGKRYEVSHGSGWPGTFAFVQLRRSNIADFDALLQTCRELAAQARRDPTELNLDFIDEIPDIPGLIIVRVAEFEEDVETAAVRRETEIIPAIAEGRLVILDFSGIRAATQSFAHACLYRVLKDTPNSRVALSIAGCTGATREAIRTVAAYAKTGATRHA